MVVVVVGPCLVTDRSPSFDWLLALFSDPTPENIFKAKKKKRKKKKEKQNKTKTKRRQKGSEDQRKEQILFRKKKMGTNAIDFN